MRALEIERASLRAWPATEQRDVDGWIARFASGYTKRANSVTVLSESCENCRIAACERFYAERGLPSIFRLLSFVSPLALDRELESRGYTVLHPTAVLQLDLGQWAPASVAAQADVHFESLDRWMDVYVKLSSQPPSHREVHRDLLTRIESDDRSPSRLLACVYDAGRAVCCALGVLDGDLFGLFDLVTDAQERNKGHATALIRAMLSWALDHGALHAYLQVMQQNEVARRLYDRLGFAPLYHYWYRVQPAEKRP